MYYVIRVYKKFRRKAHFVKVTFRGQRYVFTGRRGMERFATERDALWVVVSSQWRGSPVVEVVDNEGAIGKFSGLVTMRGRINRRTP
jgi:hypothetical protein